MNDLVKIREVSLHYGISVRTLRYYEDMGLLESIRTEDYAYREYDNAAIKRLEQILILRKLDISIKDIKAIFSTNNAAVLLETLQKKVNDIDEEVAQLNSLKKIVSNFISQIKNYSFSEISDIKMLYERINELEENMNTIENNNLGAASDEASKERISINDVNFVTIPDVRVLMLPACKMVSSGYGFFGEEKFDRFDKWFSSQRKVTPWEMPQDFLWYDPVKGLSVWWYVKPDYDVDTEDFDIVNFEGGMYATAVSKVGDDEDGQRVQNGIYKWVKKNDSLELDERPGYYTLCHVITDKAVQDTLGFCQLEILVPVKPIKK